MEVLKLSKEVLWVSVGHRAAKSKANEFDNLGKFCRSAHHAPQAYGLGSNSAPLESS